MAVPKAYKLDLNTEKRNVFVTQLHDRDDEDERVYPVVQETGDRLLETGVNTLQRTLLLKKEVEIEKVDAELEGKRNEFRQRMEACAERQIEIQKKQQRMKDRVNKFEKFIQENEAKRRRAVRKYQSEVRINKQKKDEYLELIEELEDVKARHEYLQKKLIQYKKYEDYLLRVIDIMPEDYLPSSEDKMKGLMMRHRTLSESNKDLVSNVIFMQDEVEQLRREFEELKQEHAKQKVSDSSILARLQGEQEALTEENNQREAQFGNEKGMMRKKRTDLGVIFMAIDNIFGKCSKPGVEPEDLPHWILKLLKIRDYINERKDVATMASRTHSAPSAGNPRSPKVQWKPESAKGAKS